MAEPQTSEQAKKELDEVTAKKGNQLLLVQAYLEPSSYVNFYVREDFYKYYGVKNVVATTAKKAEPKRATATTPKDTNKGNGVSYKNKGKKLPDKKIKIPTTGGDAPPVNSKNPGKLKKWMTFRVPSYLSSAAIAIWINTAFDANRRPSYFILESGTQVNIDPTSNDPAKLKTLKSFKTD
jgi:hypothetical protein